MTCIPGGCVHSVGFGIHVSNVLETTLVPFLLNAGFWVYIFGSPRPVGGMFVVLEEKKEISVITEDAVIILSIAKFLINWPVNHHYMGAPKIIDKEITSYLPQLNDKQKDIVLGRGAQIRR